MKSVLFHNGPDAPEIVLENESFADAKSFNAKREELLSIYGTVPEAVIWLEGTDKPPFPGQDEESAPAEEPKKTAAKPAAKAKPATK